VGHIIADTIHRGRNNTQPSFHCPTPATKSLLVIITAQAHAQSSHLKASMTSAPRQNDMCRECGVTGGQPRHTSPLESARVIHARCSRSLQVVPEIERCGGGGRRQHVLGDDDAEKRVKSVSYRSSTACVKGRSARQPPGREARCGRFEEVAMQRRRRRRRKLRYFAVLCSASVFKNTTAFQFCIVLDNLTKTTQFRLSQKLTAVCRASRHCELRVRQAGCRSGRVSRADSSS
jgi:hypothetical protein